MPVYMTKITGWSGSGATPEASEWDTYRNEIIRRALAKLDARNMENDPLLFDSMAVDDLKTSFETLQKIGVPLWKITRLTKTFTAPTEVLIDDQNYVCIFPHTSTSTNHPTGAEGALYWVKGGSNGVTWQSGQSYTSNNIISLSGDITVISNVKIHKSGTIRPIDIVSRQEMLDSGVDRIGLPEMVYLQKVSQTEQNLWISPIPGYDQVADNLVLTLDQVSNISKLNTNDTTRDFPDLAIGWLMYDLAIKMAPNYNKEDKIPALMLQRDEITRKLMGENTERTDRKSIKSAF